MKIVENVIVSLKMQSKKRKHRRENLCDAWTMMHREVGSLLLLAFVLQLQRQKVGR